MFRGITITLRNIKILKPPKLKKGDFVGIIAPSAPIYGDQKQNFERGIQTLQQLGLKVKYTKHIHDRYYYMAGTRETRIDDFNNMWSDPEIKMVLMTQGGQVANHLLDGINYEKIKKNPKIFAGISDGTTLLNAIFSKTGLVTYHGPDLLWTFGFEITPSIKDNIVKTFFEGSVGRLSPNPHWVNQTNPNLKYEGWKCLRKGEAKGILIGGHIRNLCYLMAAGYSPDFAKSILFLEGTDDIANLDRQFTILKLAGVFDKINGLILGWFEGSNTGNTEDYRIVSDVILEITKNYSFPILEIGELGHNVENYVFPIGCEAVMRSDELYLSIDEPTVL
ncbi:MAG: LD-carboxypeptidase [Promethearchaeota archaeon]